MTQLQPYLLNFLSIDKILGGFAWYTKEQNNEVTVNFPGIRDAN